MPAEREREGPASGRDRGVRGRRPGRRAEEARQRTRGTARWRRRRSGATVGGRRREMAGEEVGRVGEARMYRRFFSPRRLVPAKRTPGYPDRTAKKIGATWTRGPRG